MDILFERRTFFTMITGGIAASLLVFTPLNETFFFGIIYRCMYVADAMFHELGHTFFLWLFGMPAIPAIFTLFGSEQAGGVTLALDRSWFMQCVSFAALAFGCYWVKRHRPPLLGWAIGAALAVAVIAFTRYYRIVTLYMGHGGSIFMGGFLLLRAWQGDADSGFGRWMKGFFGFYLVLNNMHFAYKLATDALFREDYASPAFGGAIDNDFVAMTDVVWSWSLQGIALFTLAYCALALVVPALLACWQAEGD